ncbi:hypothetical protein B6N60_04098 [Richelia sinica FACHB-800]|uniref:Uncharacterized protein n=1 Tax=Richelia sinica FACHB-800 TaxID=1357546 RepID=A0A975TAT6_9NOST|nr:hypothetical protein [Richelia sinica]MBD2664826.1 hypothetical protein [Richelia sinica FACHB-800]QXE25383.1 hypothetical protein B6N60_04098 [Richelia sinica FACHB-800]
MSFAIVICSILLLQIPNLLPSNYSGIAKVVVLIPFWSFISITFSSHLLTPANFKQKVKLHKQRFWAFVVFILFLVFAILRSYAGISSSIYELFELITIISFGFAAFLYNQNKYSSHKLVMAICYSIPVYVVANVLLSVAGINPSPEKIAGLYGTATTQSSYFLTILGLQSHRVLFPLASGINSFGVAAGASLLLGIAMFLEEKKYIFKKIIALFITLFGLYASLMCDSRGPLFMSFLSLLFMKIAISKTRGLVPYLIVLTPLFLILFSLFIATVDIPFVEVLSRNPSSQVLTGREVIWNSAIQELSHFSLNHLLGFGIYGQAASSVSANYSDIFEKRYAINPELASLHNAQLQYIIDIGYIGLFSFITTYILTIKKLIKSANNFQSGSNNAIVLLTYFSFAGAFEVTNTIYSAETFPIFIWLVVASLNTRDI